jgi:hypothetical protein
MTTDKAILFAEDNPMDVNLTIRAFNHRNLLNPIELARDSEEALAWIER